MEIIKQNALPLTALVMLTFLFLVVLPYSLDRQDKAIQAHDDYIKSYVYELEGK